LDAPHRVSEFGATNIGDAARCHALRKRRWRHLRWSAVTPLSGIADHVSSEFACLPLDLTRFVRDLDQRNCRRRELQRGWDNNVIAIQDRGRERARQSVKTFAVILDLVRSCAALPAPKLPVPIT